MTMRFPSLPEPTAVPCGGCPWRTTSAPGWLGPQDAEAWIQTAHSDAPIMCHQTITDGTLDSPGLRQCRGTAIFRNNIHKSRPCSGSGA